MTRSSRAGLAAVAVAVGATLAGCAASATAQTDSPAAAGAKLPITVESNAVMKAAGNAGPPSTILVPASCRRSGNRVTATGKYQGGFAPEVYARYGDVIDLYVFTRAHSGYPRGFQVAELSAARFPRLGAARTWTVTVPLDLALGTPRRCLVAAQPTHDPEGAPNAY